MLQFRPQDRTRVAAGEITVSYRLWRSPHVKAEKTYETGFGRVVVEDVQLLPAGMIGDEDVRLAGCRDRAEVERTAGEHTKTTIHPDTLLYRVQFRFIGDE